MVQELWELFQLEDEGPEHEQVTAEPSDQLFLAISKATVNGVLAPRTVRFSGSIQQFPASILVDSGSSTSFISCQLASRLSGVQQLQVPILYILLVVALFLALLSLPKLSGLLALPPSSQISSCCH